MNRLCAVALFAVAMAAPISADPIADPAVALEKAVQIEQTTDNAAEAESIYRQIIADHERRAAAAAEAKYRLGAMLLEQGKKEEGRTVLMGLLLVPQRSANEWRSKAVGLLGEVNSGPGAGFNPEEMQAFVTAMGVASQVAKQAPYGMDPGSGPADPFAQGQDPFANRGMDPFGSGMGMMMGGEGMMFGGEGMFDPGMGFRRAPSPPMRSLEQIREAEELLAKLELESARHELQLKTEEPDTSAPHYQWWIRREESLRNLVGLVRANPEAPNQWIQLGEFLLGREKLADAEAAYKQALELKPPSQLEARVLSMLGQIAMKQDQEDQAMMHFTHAVHADDTVMAAWMGLATLAEKRGDTHSAIRNLHRVLQREPDNREARALLQKIDPDAESAPAPRTESELAAARELAMNEGRFEDALTLEERRLQLRIDAFNPWVDTLSFSGLAKEWADKHNPSEERISEAIMAVDSRRKLLTQDDHRQWRFWLVMAELAEAKGDPASAYSWYQNAMNRYPQRTYADPAKHSFYQHLMNSVAVEWWKNDGRDMAIQNVINYLESERRLQSLHVEWWLDRIAEGGGDADFQRRFLERVIQAYDKRAERFRDQAGIIAAEKQILHRRIEQLRK